MIHNKARLLTALALLALALGGLPHATARASATPAASATTWPTFHYDTAHTGDNTAEHTLSVNNVFLLQLAWRYHTGDHVRGSVAIANGTVYAPSDNDYLYALNATTGALTGKIDGGTSLETSPTVAGQTAYVSGHNGNVRALNLKTGAERWVYTLDNGTSSSPNVSGNLLYVGGNNNQIVAVSATTGKPAWSYTTGNVVISSPTLGGGLVYAGSQDQNLYALNAATGKIAWTYRAANKIISTPVYANGSLYFGSIYPDNGVYALNASTGAFRWKYSTASDVDGAVAYANGNLYVTTNDWYGGIYALNATTGKVLWATSIATSGYNNGFAAAPAVANGVLYVASTNGTVAAYDTATGIQLWRYLTGGQILSAPVVVNGMLYVGSDDGYVYAFSLPKPQPKSMEKGMSYPTWWYNDYLSTTSDQSIASIPTTTAANWISLVPTWYENTYTDTVMFPNYSGSTATDASVVHAIQQAHADGLKVMLKPHIDSGDYVWRGQFAPTDPNAWFSNYTAFITHYAQLAQQNNVEQFSIGCELASMTVPAYTSHWRAIIAAVRAVYSGKLTYAANWGDIPILTEFTHIQFWDALDLIGIDEYANLTNRNDPTLDQMLQGWTAYNPTPGYYFNRVIEVATVQRQFNKPVIFTEIGCSSYRGANKTPWQWPTGGETVDLTEQQNYYESVLRTWATIPWVQGFFWWNWDTSPTAGGLKDPGFTPQGKPAQTTLKTWYSKL